MQDPVKLLERLNKAKAEIDFAKRKKAELEDECAKIKKELKRLGYKGAVNSKALEKHIGKLNTELESKYNEIVESLNAVENKIVKSTVKEG